MPKTIYALSTGAYSDYSVEALFTDKRTAEEAVKAQKADSEYSDEARVETFDLWDEVPERVTVYSMMEEIWDDGTTSHFRSQATTALPWNHLFDYESMGRPKVDFIRAPMHKDKGGRLEVRGTDEQAVRQAFSDRKARRLAEIAGIS